MDLVKQISFSIASLSLGCVLLVLGLTNGIPLNASSILKVEGSVSRVILCTIGLSAIGFSAFLELARRRGSSSEAKGGRDGKLKPHFFETVEDRVEENFQNLVKDATRVSILARTAVNLTSQYVAVFERLLGSGTHVRMMFVDPECEVSKYVYGSNPDDFRHNARTSLIHLRRLTKRAPDKLKIRVMKHAPTMGLIIVERNDASTGFIRASLYFLHTRVGRDRPVFRISKSDPWFSSFEGEFEAIWQNATDLDLS